MRKFAQILLFAQKGLPTPPVHRQPPAEWEYLLDESAFLQQKLDIGALDLF